MVTAEEALRSDDPNEVKRLRGSISTQIACDIKLLQKELAKKTGNSYDFEKISPQLIKTQRKKLQSHFELIQKLQERFVEIREEGLTAETETALVEADVAYMEDITSRVCPLLDSIDQFEEGLASLTKNKSLLKSGKEKQDAVIKAKQDFKIIHDKIKEELDLIETLTDGDEKNKQIQLIPTESFIRDLSVSYSEVKRTCARFKEIYQASENSENEPKLDAICEYEYSIYVSLDIRLKKYDQAKGFIKICSSSEKSTKDAGMIAPLKINKPEALKFSGEAREFAPFKRDFLAMVVPNRDNTQIGMHLKQAIPEKHKHLVSNKDLDDWSSMLDVLEEELANPKLIIDITVGEIERMKTATTDKGFIDFVEALEKIERDLTTLDQLAEIANTSVLSKLESKLPSQINHDWTQKVIRDKLNKKTTMEKFKVFMEFLKESKDMTKYNISLPSSRGRNICFITGSFVV